MSLMKLFCAILTPWLMAPPLMAKPMPSGRPTPIELRALPDYCQARFGTDEGARKAFSQRLGPSHYLHIHHHCIGLNLLNRSKVTFDKTMRNYYLKNAVGEFSYVLARWPADFLLTAEARDGKAIAEALLSTASKRR